MDFYQQFRMGYTLVPNGLIYYFHRLNLTANEYLVITALLSYQATEHVNQSIERLSKQFGWDTNLTMEVINSLINKKLILLEMVEASSGKQYDCFSLKPLFQKLSDLQEEPTVLNSDESAQIELGQDNFKTLLKEFEQAFNRLLTSKELEMLNQWVELDHYELALIRMALKEACIHQVYNFTYIDRILLGWEKQNIKTPLEAQAALKRYAKKEDQLIQRQNQPYDHIEIPIYKFNESQANN